MRVRSLARFASAAAAPGVVANRIEPPVAETHASSTAPLCARTRH